MHDYWFRYWWLFFPVVGFAFAFWAIWMSHQRQKAVIDLLRTYASQGKDPPVELIKALHDGDEQRGPHRDWQNAVLFGALSVGLGVMAYLQQGMRPRTGLIVAAIVLAALTVNALVAAFLKRKHDAS